MFAISEKERAPLLLPVLQERSRRSYRQLMLFNLCLLFVSLWLLQRGGQHAYRGFKSSRDPDERAAYLMKRHPLIDGHIDVPVYVRYFYNNQALDMDFDLVNATTDVSIPRLREGRVGGFFWSLFVPCANEFGSRYDEGSDFLNATWRVRDTLEQFDVARLVIEKYKEDFAFAETANDVRRAFKQGKIASLFGLEGAHQIGNSLGVLRQYRKLGARYMTLTHTCNNAFADSCGYDNKPIEPIHGGLSTFGKVLVQEMNRIGMMVDVSHTTAKTAADVLTYSRAPPIFSHSLAQSLYPSVRNVPDYILERISRSDLGDRSASGVLGGDSLIMANFVPPFLSNGTSTLEMVADQIEYLGKKAGRRHVGIGSDFDGIGPGSRVEGLENVSKYPLLIAEMIRRGWTNEQVIGLMGGNLLRILDAVDEVAHSMRFEPAATDIYSKRTDLDLFKNRHPKDDL